MKYTKSKTNLYLRIFFSIILSFSFYSCKSDSAQKILFIGHKGSGPIGHFGNVNLLENSWDAISNAMQQLDGSEIDLQLSADSTLWIFHDEEIINCHDSLINFSVLSDSVIEIFNACKYQNKIFRFSDFIEKSKEENWKNKILCLDLKLLINPKANQLFSTREGLYHFLLNKLKQTTENSSFQFLFEVFTIEEYELFQQNFPNQVFLVENNPTNDFILKNNRNQVRLSLPIYNLPKEKDSLKIFIQDLWTINDANQFFKSLHYSPILLQSDNIPMMYFFKQIRDKQVKLKAEVYSFQFESDEEFDNLFTEIIEVQKDYLLKMEWEETLEEDVILVVQAYDENEETVYWEGVKPIEKNCYLYINPDFFQKLDATIYKISIWNKEKHFLKNEVRVSKIQQK